MSLYKDRVRKGRELHALALTWTESLSFDEALKTVKKDHDDEADFEWAVAADGVLERIDWLETRDRNKVLDKEYLVWREQYAKEMREYLRSKSEI